MREIPIYTVALVTLVVAGVFAILIYRIAAQLILIPNTNSQTHIYSLLLFNACAWYLTAIIIYFIFKCVLG